MIDYIESIRQFNKMKLKKNIDIRHLLAKTRGDIRHSQPQQSFATDDHIIGSSS